MYEFYLFSLLSSIVLLVLWQTLGSVRGLSRLLGILFLVSIVSYAMSLFQLHLKDYYSLKIVFRDLILMSFISFVSILAKKSKMATFSWIAFTAFSSYVLFLNRSLLIPKDFELDENAELLIKLSHSSDKEFNNFLQKENITIQRAFYPEHEASTELDNYYTLDLDRSDPFYLNKVKQKILAFPSVEVLEENEEITVAPLISEPAKSTNSDLRFNDPLVKEQWALKALNIQELNDLISRDKKDFGKKSKLFILDTGVDASHEDIKENYLSINRKYDSDKQSHGTHCAGIAGAVSNNKIGVSSLSMNNQLFTISGIKVLNDSGMGSQKKIIDGIIEAADKGADVISLSLGGRSTDKRQKLYEETVKYANHRGAIVVVAAGNSSMNAKDYSPANTPGVIAVAAIDENLNMARFSNSVEDLSMGLAAPGVNILSTVPGNEYKAFNGTSMATPYVSALAAIMKSLNPQLTTTQVFDLMNNNGQNIQQSKSGNLINPVKTVKNLLGQ